MGKQLESLGLSNTAVAGRQCSEANLFSRFGVETLLFGPGVFDRSNTVANESARISELQKAAEVYEQLIGDLCS